MLSVVLEVFQLGVLFPAAAFNHSETCLEYMAPLGVDMHLVRDIIVTFGCKCQDALSLDRES